MENKKQLVLSLSKEKGDFVVETFSGSGAGGQNRNRKQKCVRIKHPASGAVATATEERSLEQNKKKAFRRLLETDTFKKWYKIAVSKACGMMDDIDKTVDKMLKKENLKIEVKEDGKYKEISLGGMLEDQ